MERRPARNRILAERPDDPRESFAYREAPAVEYAVRTLVLACGILIAVLAPFATNVESVAGTLLPYVAAIGMILLAIRPRHADQATLFVCDAMGLYFPARNRAHGQPSSWLFIPWTNVVDYRLQPMLDETSGPGLALSLIVSGEEEQAFFSRHRLFRLGERHPDPSLRTIVVGFPAFLPRPTDVLPQLRRFERTHWQELAFEPVGSRTQAALQ